MTSLNYPSDQKTTRKVFTRPANLHLAWSASRDASSSPDHGKSSSSAGVLHKPYFPSAPPQISMSAVSHPYNVFVPAPRNGDIGGTSETLKSSSSAPSFHLPSRRSLSRSSDLLLKTGHLTLRTAADTTCRRGALGGFEKALRRRQAAKDQVTDREQEVFVTLDRHDPTSTNSLEQDLMSWNFHSASSHLKVSNEPFLASPGASDPSAFDNDGLASFQPRPVPSCLSDQSRWIPPPSWDVLDTLSDSQDLHSRSPTSTISDPLQTPRTSQPGSPMDPEFYLNLYTRNDAKCRGSSHGSLQLRFRLTRSSTVEMQPCPSEVDHPDDSKQLRRRQLVITGDALGASNSVRFENNHRGSANSVCILSSANVADLNEWLESIESVINQCRYLGRHGLDAGQSHDYFGRQHLGARRSSGSMPETIRLLEQLKGHEGHAEYLEEMDEQSTPMVNSLSLPSLVVPTSSTRLSTQSTIHTHSDFSTSPFIDYYAVTDDYGFEPDSAADCPQSTAAQSASGSLYSFEDAYMSIMRRYADSDFERDLSKPLTVPSERLVEHARTENLDVPVSPCSFEFGREDWDSEVEAPGSPLDPWLTQHAARSVTSLSTSLSSSVLGDDTVMQIFAEGFRRRSSSHLGL
ncbi:integral subunit of the pre-mRNA cleavage and polyadenylation factor complex [Pseudozyma hubeiensis SY62]|uniref:Integral subunit of the pre-mRNA cleavage and polyadenylation factor complex n=1 Tax=Pseudozyma hubeiensis (strain SY62) TaxID=1305764 RepID=R9P2F9_PSEHS|nr:integral subunit of the pre-mRNA cleavage and polyadenylation factor complex [Pseudozyma hubeiensis SY62]GAC95506.1 integral subunit of the pre-mRNA cleavage and polyadenylation factor complex [Pseudozyma hubeiensis SY62]